MYISLDMYIYYIKYTLSRENFENTKIDMNNILLAGIIPVSYENMSDILIPNSIISAAQTLKYMYIYVFHMLNGNHFM